MFTRKFYLSLLTSLFFAFGAVAQDTIVIDKVVAVVGKQVILKSDIETQALQLRSQGYYSSGDIYCEVLEEALYSKLMVNQAFLDSVEVNDVEVISEVERRMNYFITQIGSEEAFEQYYKKSVEEFKEEFKTVIREQMLAARMGQQVTADINVTPQEVKSFYKNLPKDSLPIVNTQFELGQIIVHPKIEETEILRIKDRLRDFKKRVTEGESFATLAVLYSEDPGSATKGGDLGFFGRGDMVDEFSAVAFNLKEGEVSKIVKTDFGYHIIQMLEKKGERINCRHILMKPKISLSEKQEASKRLDTVRTAILEDRISFKEACWKFSDDEETRLNGGLMVNPNTGNSKYEASQLEPKIAYAIGELEVGDISEPFESEDDKGRTVYRIVVLRSKSDPHPANMKDDYQVIQDLALTKKKTEYLNNWMSKKIEKTYIKIDNDYKNCTFRNESWKQ